MVKTYHPDINKAPDAVEFFAEINEAHETLGNSERRKIYDETGMSSNEQQNSKQQGQGHSGAKAFKIWDFFSVLLDFSKSMEKDTRNNEEVIKEYEKFFMMDPSKIYQQNQDLYKKASFDVEMDLEIDFMEAVRGVTKQVQIERATICRTCLGNRTKPGSGLYSCDSCNG